MIVLNNRMVFRPKGISAMLDEDFLSSSSVSNPEISRKLAFGASPGCISVIRQTSRRIGEKGLEADSDSVHVATSVALRSEHES